MLLLVHLLTSWFELIVISLYGFILFFLLDHLIFISLDHSYYLCTFDLIFKMGHFHLSKPYKKVILFLIKIWLMDLPSCDLFFLPAACDLLSAWFIWLTAFSTGLILTAAWLTAFSIGLDFFFIVGLSSWDLSAWSSPICLDYLV